MRKMGFHMWGLLILCLTPWACSGSGGGSGLPACELWVNGTEMLSGAHHFRDGDQEIGISSLGSLDVVSCFQKDSAGYRLQVRLINAGDERVDVRSLSLWDVEDRDTDEGSLWSFRTISGKKGKGVELDLSESSLVLLPGEEIRLPWLMLFLPSL